MSAVNLPDAALRRRVRAQRFARTDHWLLGAALTLLALGLVMVTSASITSADRLLGQPFYYLLRQSAYIVVGLFCAYTVWRIPMSAWNKAGPYLLVIAYVLLLAVLIHGVGRAVNGSRRWIPMGLFNLQVSEPAKLFAFIYIAGYLVRRGDEVARQDYRLCQTNGPAHDHVHPVVAGAGLRRLGGVVKHSAGHDVSCRRATLAVWRLDPHGWAQRSPCWPCRRRIAWRGSPRFSIPGPILSTAVFN